MIVEYKIIKDSLNIGYDDCYKNYLIERTKSSIIIHFIDKSNEHKHYLNELLKCLNQEKLCTISVSNKFKYNSEILIHLIYKNYERLISFINKFVYSIHSNHFENVDFYCDEILIHPQSKTINIYSTINEYTYEIYDLQFKISDQCVEVIPNHNLNKSNNLFHYRIFINLFIDWMVDKKYNLFDIPNCHYYALQSVKSKDEISNDTIYFIMNNDFYLPSVSDK